MSGVARKMVQEVKAAVQEVEEALPKALKSGETHAKHEADDVAAAVDGAEHKVASASTVIPHQTSLPAPSRATAPVISVESSSPAPVRPKDAVSEWRKFVGSNATNVHPRTGLPDPDRLVSSDGTRSIRFGPHEMGSSPTKFHYHEESWSYDETTHQWLHTNVIRRVPFPKGSW